MSELLFWNNITANFGVFLILFLYALGENVLLYTLLLNCLQFAIQRVKRVETKSRRMIYWQKIVTRGRSLPRRDIVPSRRAKGEKQWPWRDDMPAQCHHCRNNKGCCWATRIRGHGNRGALNYPESIMLLLPNRNAPPQRSCPLMYLLQAGLILILMFAPPLSYFLHPATPQCGCQPRTLTCDLLRQQCANVS